MDFCRAKNFSIANTYFKQQVNRLYTGTSPDGQHRYQIDYVIVSRRWRSYILPKQDQKQTVELTTID